MSTETLTKYEVQIRPAAEADTPRILELVRGSLGEGSIPRDLWFWKWKHAENPFGRSPCLVAEADGEVVGLRMFMRWLWQCDGELVNAVRAVDTATHPEFRGKGIFSRLTRGLVERVQSEDVALIYNTPNRFSRPGYLKMGWRSMGRISLWIRPRGIRKLLGLLAPTRLNGSGRIPPMGFEPRIDYPTVNDLLREPGVSSFLSEGKQAPRRLATPLTPEYLKWRYGDIPGFVYYSLWDVRDEQGAILIFRLKRHGEISELRLCELVIGPGDCSRKWASRLLSAAARGVDCDAATVTAPHRTSEQLVLLGAGYIPAPHAGPVLTVRPLKGLPKGLDPVRRASWALSIGDLEIF